MPDRYSDFAKEALEKAQTVSNELGHGYIGSEHLLLGILSVGNCAGALLLGARGVGYEKVRALIERYEPPASFLTAEVCDITPRLKRALEKAASCAGKYKSDSVGSEHLLFGILEEGGAAVHVLSCAGVLPSELREDLKVYMSGTSLLLRGGGSGKRFEALEKYAKDLCRAAEEGQIDPIIGQEEVIDRTIRVLCRRNKNNPCLVGEPGVGKTAAVEGLAQRIAMRKAPHGLCGAHIWSLDLSALVAGAKYRGEFEDRLKNVISEAKDPSVILFIDEIHTLIGAGSAEGAMDGANILKPSLARGEIRLIGATTNGEYRRYIERDAALERRFAKITVEEPDREQTIAILEGLRARYEQHHGVRIDDDAIKRAVDLSIRYMPERFLPDKAIDLLDEACADLRVEEEVIKSACDSASSVYKRENAEDFGGVSHRLAVLIDQRKEEKQRTSPCLTAKRVEDVLGKQLHTPLCDDQNALEERLTTLLPGKKENVALLCRSLSDARREGRKRPIGVFLLRGGDEREKKAFAHGVAAGYFGSDAAYSEIRLGRYGDRQSISELLGSPPGYVGYNEGGVLALTMRRNPRCLLFFDEVEKAHPEVRSILSQIIEDGLIVDAAGKTVSFRSAILFLSLSCGGARRAAGYIRSDLTHDTANDLKDLFPEQTPAHIDGVLDF